MADWFVSPIMNKLIDACFEYLQDQVEWQTGMKEAVERLQKLHPMIQSVVFAYSQAQIRDQNPALNRWLWQLRDAIDEADDVLDDFEYMKHKQQLTKSMEETTVRSTANLLLETFQDIGQVCERVLKIDSNLKRLEEVVQKLDEVSADVGTFLSLLESTRQVQQEQQLELHKTRETGSLPKNDQIGRGKETEFIRQWLKKQEDGAASPSLYRNISLLSIVGHGGMGKTTLLQHVYEDEMTEKFDPKIWVCVSNNFDVKRVITEMLESLTKKKPDLGSLDALQGSLKAAVSSKKFLLVLDDVWEEEEEERDRSKWENVLAPLASGSSGSKILVTTRMDSVALMIAKVIKKKKETLRMEGLKEDECLQLLNSHAFADVEKTGEHKKLKSITEKIVKKLSGSPLAAKVMGSVLNSSFDERHWIKVLNSNIGSAELGQNDISPILRLNYRFLTKPLQSCFAFCSIFPQDHEFDRDDLVQMWIALGFIQPSSNSGETMEEIGGRYFDVLVKKSFFDEFQGVFGVYYKMHDLLHEVSHSIFSQECFRIMSDEELLFRIPKTIRHVFVKAGNLEVLRKVRGFKNLRSLYLNCWNCDQDFVEVLSEIFETSTSIRLLYISAPLLETIPEAIGNLIHLRYLNFSRTTVVKLPRSLSKLYHLQFIIDNENGRSLCHDFLPKDMNNLFNLHHLKLPWDVLPGMNGIGKLNYLQELDGFYVKNEVGYGIGELKHMNELRRLRIKFLENVKNVEEACSAKLYHKRNLTELSLAWGDIHLCGWKTDKIYVKKETSWNIARPNLDERVDLDEKVFDKLQPHSGLKTLRIYSFMGARSAIWMNNADLISNLEYIQLNECFMWQHLPPFGQLPFLKSLYLDNMPKVKRLDNKFHGNDKDCVFPALEVLHINKLEALEVWFDASATTGEYLFPCLTELNLTDCPNLVDLPCLPPKLMKLEIENIGWKDFNWLQGTSNCCIQELTTKRNDELTTLPEFAEQCFLQASQSIKSSDIKSLQCLSSSLSSLSSLKILRVKKVPQLQLLPNIPGSLERLVLDELESLQCLPPSLSISSLEYLYLTGIPLLKSLPDLPHSLCVMSLTDLNNLEFLPSCLSLSFLRELDIKRIPRLQELPYLPPSLCVLHLVQLENLNCLPACLPRLSSLRELNIDRVPHLHELSDLPLSLCKLYLADLDDLDCLPSCLPSLSSLQEIHISNVSQLQKLPDLPPSVCKLYLADIIKDCLPSCLPSLSSLQVLSIAWIPQLVELPDLPPSLKQLIIYNCQPELMERYRKYDGPGGEECLEDGISEVL